MDFLNWIFQNKIVEMIVSGLVGWIISRILDPSGNQTSRQNANASNLNVTQVNIYVQRRIYVDKSTKLFSRESDVQQIFMLIMLILTALVLVAIITYGSFVVQIVRFFVATTGFAAIFLALRITRSTTFNQNSWVTRLAVMISVCIVLWFSLDYVESGIQSSIVRAQKQGYRIVSLKGLIDVFGFSVLLQLWYLAVALIIATAVSIISMIAQWHMLLLAHAATDFQSQDWRIALLNFMGNRSSASTFLGLVFLSLMTFALSSGIWQKMFVNW